MRRTNRIGQETDDAVIKALRENGGSATVLEAAEALRWKENTARVALERLFEDGRLIRRNMKVKMYVNGHANKRSRYVYTLTEMQDILSDVYDAEFTAAKITDERIAQHAAQMKPSDAVPADSQAEDCAVPDFTILPEGMTDRRDDRKDEDTAEEERDGLHETAVQDEGTSHTQTARDDGIERMTYAEALVAIFEGKKVVSDVTGTMYRNASTEGITGLVSSKDTEKIVLSFSEEEKKGTWHIKAEAGVCPFCGSPSRLTTVTKSGGKRFHKYVCTSEVCLAEGPLSKDMEGAAIAYNRRV